MPASTTAVLLSSVALFAVTAFFLLALIPLVFLRHKSPQDSGVVQRLLAYSYAAAILTSASTVVSYAFAGMPMPALAAVALVMLGVGMRRHFLPAINALRAALPFSTRTAQRFRQLHACAIGVQTVQLLAVVGIINGYAPL